MELAYSPQATRALGRMPKRDAEALMGKLKQFASDPASPCSFVKPLIGGGVRVRHGDWRAVCVIDGEQLIVLVVRVGHRREVYR